MFDFFSKFRKGKTAQDDSAVQNDKTIRSDKAPKKVVIDGVQYEIEGDLLRNVRGMVTDWVVPEGVKAIASLAISMETKKTLISVVVPEGIETIRANTFENCPGLVSVTLPESLRSIRTKAFANCPKLSEINFPEGLRDIAEDAFSGCPDLIIPYTAEKKTGSPAGFASAFRSIPDKTLCEDGILQQGGFDTPAHVVVPEGVRVIGRAAFAFFQIESVVLSEGVEVIEDGAFSLCDHLVSVHLPDTLYQIGKDAFSCCSELREINFPDSLLCVSPDAFTKCNKISIPQRVKKLMNNPNDYPENKYMKKYE